MAAKTTSRRRLSLDMIHKAVSDFSNDGGILKYMDLRSTPVHAASGASLEVCQVSCECCGLSEDCTREYVRRVRDRFCGRWVCGLCSEAVKEEEQKGHVRLGHAAAARSACAAVIREEALAAHTSACRRFNRVVRANPAKYVASAMADILRKNSKKVGAGRRNGGDVRESYKVLRAYSDVI